MNAVLFNYFHRNKATTLSEIDLYPLEKYENNTAVEVDGNIFCSNSSGAPSSIGLILFKSSLVRFVDVYKQLP